MTDVTTYSDLVLVSAGSGSSTLNIDDSLGIPPGVSRRDQRAHNDPTSLRNAVTQYGPEIAAALVEPIVGNFGIVPPEPGFLQLLEEQMRQCGALVIWDEVITAFRYTYGSIQQVFGLSPDIITLGKIIGGGLPIGAYGARLQLVAPLGGIIRTAPWRVTRSLWRQAWHA